MTYQVLMISGRKKIFDLAMRRLDLSRWKLLRFSSRDDECSILLKRS